MGSAAVLATLASQNALASDAFEPLIEIWRTLQDDVDLLIQSYGDRHHAMVSGEKVAEYEKIKASYNHRPNGADFLRRFQMGGQTLEGEIVADRLMLTYR